MGDGDLRADATANVKHVDIQLFRQSKQAEMILFVTTTLFIEGLGFVNSVHGCSDARLTRKLVAASRLMLSPLEMIKLPEISSCFAHETIRSRGSHGGLGGLGPFLRYGCMQ
jgi:hypothetical protein